MASHGALGIPLSFPATTVPSRGRGSGRQVRRTRFLDAHRHQVGRLRGSIRGETPFTLTAPRFVRWRRSQQGN